MTGRPCGRPWHEPVGEATFISSQVLILSVSCRQISDAARQQRHTVEPDVPAPGRQTEETVLLLSQCPLLSHWTGTEPALPLAPDLQERRGGEQDFDVMRLSSLLFFSSH